MLHCFFAWVLSHSAATDLKENPTQELHALDPNVKETVNLKRVTGHFPEKGTNSDIAEPNAYTTPTGRILRGLLNRHLGIRGHGLCLERLSLRRSLGGKLLLLLLLGPLTAGSPAFLCGFFSRFLGSCS